MSTSPKDILIEVLTIIGYNEDKEEFATNFIALCYKGALASLLDSLPEETQKKIAEETKGMKNLDDILKVLKNYVNPGEYEKYVEKTTTELFVDYLKTIIPTLSPDIKEKLGKYLQTLGPDKKA